MKAERLYRAAVKRYEKAVKVVCNRRIDRASAVLVRSGNTMRHAMDVLARPACRRIGLRTKEHAEDLCRKLSTLGSLPSMVDEHSPTMLAHVLKDLPTRERFDKWLIGDGRTVLNEFNRVARLGKDSEEYRRIRQLIESEKRRWQRQPSGGTAKNEAAPPPATGTRAIERRVRRADKLLARAGALSEEAIGVFCGTAIRRAKAKIEKASDLGEVAISLLREPVLARLDRRDERSFHARTFVDESTTTAIGLIDRATPRRREYLFYEAFEIPDADSFRHSLIDEPRQIIAALAGIARLPKDAVGIQRIKESLKETRPPKDSVHK